MQEIINKMVIIHPIVNTWGGKKRLEAGDLTGVQLPDKLINLGAKKIVPTSTLRPFETFKKQLERTLGKTGIKLIGGYAVAEDNHEAVEETLKEFEQKFEELKADFLQNFPRYVDQQVADWPEWEGSLRAGAAEVLPDLADRFRFGWKAYKLVPPENSQEKAEQAQDGKGDNFFSDDEVMGQMAREIAMEADKLLMRLASQNQEQIRPVSLNHIRKVIREKLMNLSSLDRTFFGKTVYLIDTVLGEMPTNTYIQERERKMITSLLLLLRNVTEEPYRSELLAGNYDDPDALMMAMGYGVNSNAAAEQDSEQEAEEEAEEEEAETLDWF
ncbi:MAG: DUF3150 domain-containing protein [Desulfobacteraceae bacterium]|nr:DUF3150 domain-containing protein [Desulfobacteraceae bacterium]